MTVPKAAMNESHRFEFGQYNIEAARKVALVKTESKARAMQSRPYGQLRFRIATLHTAHQAAVRFLAEMAGQLKPRS